MKNRLVSLFKKSTYSLKEGKSGPGPCSGERGATRWWRSTQAGLTAPPGCRGTAFLLLLTVAKYSRSSTKEMPPGGSNTYGSIRRLPSRAEHAEPTNHFSFYMTSLFRSHRPPQQSHLYFPHAAAAFLFFPQLRIPTGSSTGYRAPTSLWRELREPTPAASKTLWTERMAY